MGSLLSLIRPVTGRIISLRPQLIIAPSTTGGIPVDITHNMLYNVVDTGKRSTMTPHIQTIQVCNQYRLFFHFFNIFLIIY